jgi:hypothetical protein
LKLEELHDLTPAGLKLLLPDAGAVGELLNLSSDLKVINRHATLPVQNICFVFYNEKRGMATHSRISGGRTITIARSHRLPSQIQELLARSLRRAQGTVPTPAGFEEPDPSHASAEIHTEAVQDNNIRKQRRIKNSARVLGLRAISGTFYPFRRLINIDKNNQKVEEDECLKKLSRPFWEY